MIGKYLLVDNFVFLYFYISIIIFIYDEKG